MVTIDGNIQSKVKYEESLNEICNLFCLLHNFHQQHFSLQQCLAQKS